MRFRLLVLILLKCKVDGRVQVWALCGERRISRRWSEEVFDGYSSRYFAVGGCRGGKIEMVCLNLLMKEILERTKLVLI